MIIEGNHLFCALVAGTGTETRNTLDPGKAGLTWCCATSVSPRSSVYGMGSVSLPCQYLKLPMLEARGIQKLPGGVLEDMYSAW